MNAHKCHELANGGLVGYGGVVKLHCADAEIAKSALESVHITRVSFL